MCKIISLPRAEADAHGEAHRQTVRVWSNVSPRWNPPASSAVARLQCRAAEALEDGGSGSNTIENGKAAWLDCWNDA